MPDPKFSLYLRDNEYKRILQIEDYAIEAVKNFRDIGTFILDIPYDPSLLPYINLQTGIEVIQDDVSVIFSGPSDKIRKVKREGEASWEVSGFDDNAWLADRVPHPQPTTATPPYNSDEFDERTGDCSTIISEYVDYNLGPSALADRQLPGLTIAPDTGLGSTRTGQARWQESLLIFLQSLATLDEIGFEIVQVGNGLVFRTYDPMDRSAYIIFSEELANLGDYEYEQQRPTGNYVYAGGDGDGTARTIQEGEDSFSIGESGRFERFLDAGNTTDSTQLTQQINDELIKESGKSSFSFTAAGLPYFQYGADYVLGDKVTVVIDEVAIADIVRSITIKIAGGSDNQVANIYPTVGTANAQNLKTQAPALYNRLVAAQQRIRQLERR